MRRRGNTWPKPHDVALKTAIEKGCTFTQAASVLKDLFGVVYSRSAIGGRASRLKIRADKVVTREKALRSLEIARASRPPARHPPRKKPMPKPVQPTFIAEPTAGLRSVDVPTRDITIYELTDQTCRWPRGERPPFTYCGCPVWESSSYCAEHEGLARSPGTRGEQMATRGLARVV